MESSHPSPLVSVVLPTYNRRSTLGRAVSSVLNQSLEDFELIVVDDGSTDGTGDVVSAVRDPRLLYIQQPNAGRSAARNRGAANARGTWLTFLDSDDEALPGWLENLMAAAYENPRADVVCCGFRAVVQAEDGERVHHGVRLPSDLGPVYGHRVGLFNAGTFAVRRSLFERLGGYADGLDFAENTELALRLAATDAQVAAVRKPLVLYTLRTPGRARSRAGVEARFEGARYILRHHGEHHRRKKASSYANYCAIAGVNAVRLNRIRTARRFFCDALKATPLAWRHQARLLLCLVPPLARRFWSSGRANETPS